MESYEALPGTPVRVGVETRRPQYSGMEGVIERSFGSPEHPALDVRMADGKLELFWFHQLERAEEPQPRSS